MRRLAVCLALIAALPLIGAEHQFITLSSSHAQVVITTDRGAIVSFSSLDVAPISLPKHLHRFAAVPESATSVPILGDQWSGGTTGLDPRNHQEPTLHGYLYSDTSTTRFSGLTSRDRKPWQVADASSTHVVLRLDAFGLQPLHQADAGGQRRGGAECFLRDLLEALIVFAPIQLQDRAFGCRHRDAAIDARVVRHVAVQRTADREVGR